MNLRIPAIALTTIIVAACGQRSVIARGAAVRHGHGGEAPAGADRGSRRRDRARPHGRDQVEGLGRDPRARRGHGRYREEGRAAGSHRPAHSRAIASTRPPPSSMRPWPGRPMRGASSIAARSCSATRGSTRPTTTSSSSTPQPRSRRSSPRESRWTTRASRSTTRRFVPRAMARSSTRKSSVARSFPRRPWMSAAARC